MNILIFSWRGPGHPNEGGAEQSTHEHAKAWISVGHKVTLFTSGFSNGKPQENVDGVEVIRRGDQIITVQIAGFLWYLFGKHKKYDLIVDQFHGLPFFTPIYTKVKVLGFIHEIAGDVWKLNPWKPPFNKIPAFFGPRVEKLLFRVLYKQTPFLTVSDSTKNDLLGYGVPTKNITVINNGVNTLNIAKLPPKENKNTAMFLGALAEDKGVFDAVNIFSEIHKADNDWQFWIVGKGGDAEIEKVSLLASELGISKNLKLFGFVSQRRKFELLSRSHILLNPSFHEGWGLVNIEANSVGTPVVAYDVHGSRDSVKNKLTGILVEKGDINKMAYSVISLVRREKEYKEYQRNSISWSKKFNWEQSGKFSLQLIESL